MRIAGPAVGLHELATDDTMTGRTERIRDFRDGSNGLLAQHPDDRPGSEDIGFHGASINDW